MKLINILLVLFLLSFVSATSILQSPLIVNTQVGQNSSYTITINNTYSFPIFDFKFPILESKGFKFPNISVPENSTLSFPFIVNTNTSFYGMINEQVEFKFYVNIPETISSYTMNISENGLSETYKVIRKGDTIIWYNKDDISHTIYSSEFGSLYVPVNSSAQYTFNNIGNIYYYDEYFNIFTNFNGNIEVINRTEQQKAHNPNYDISWSVDLSSVSNPTDLSVSNSKNIHTIVYGNLSKGLLTIQNIGNETAEGISLTSKWITFEKNDFNINVGDTDWIEYQILPNGLTTNETEKNYTITISIKAKNSPQKNISLNVYIPFKEITGDIKNDFDYAMWLQNTFCPSHPCSVQCSPELPQCFSDGSGNNSLGLEINANISKIDLYNLMKDIAKLKDSSSRSDNSIKELADLYGLTVPELTNLVNQSLNTQINNEKKTKSNINTMWIVGSLILFTIGMILIVNQIYKKNERRRRIGFPYEHK